jgi:hypothetical protein
MDRTPTDFTLQELQTPNNRLSSGRSHGNPKDWRRKRPKVKNITRENEKETKEGRRT